MKNITILCILLLSSCKTSNIQQEKVEERIDENEVTVIDMMKMLEDLCIKDPHYDATDIDTTTEEYRWLIEYENNFKQSVYGKKINLH